VTGLTAQAVEFRERLRHLKTARPFPWYPYDSLACLPQIERMIEDRPGLLEHVRSSAVLDVGCGDGDLSFFFESLGFRVTAIDFEPTNFNRMQGVRALRTQLASSVDVHSVDLDGRGAIPGGPFGLCFLLGILYHVKNPFHLLESIAHEAEYCLLSTRIAQRTPRGADMSGDALAYLVDPEELNNDRTNFWVFSAAGLKRIVTRAGWTVCRFESPGDFDGSDPVHADRDERAWCLLRSRLRTGARARLGEGWYALENETYRWTQPSFSAIVTEPAAFGAKLEFRFTSTHAMTLTARAGAVELARIRYSEPGEHTLVAPVAEGPVGEIRFTVDPPLKAPGDVRNLGVLVTFWNDGAGTSDDHVPIEIVY
jgi:tRNA (mo5U34)-methyltransferase